jgi:hypothetical protein
VDRISAGRFEDTNQMFVAPARFDPRVSAEGAPQYWAEQALAQLRPALIRESPQLCSSRAISRFTPDSGALSRRASVAKARRASPCATPIALTKRIR